MRRIALLLTVAIGTAALLAFFYPRMMVIAADTMPVEGESFVLANANHTVVSDPMYSGGQALKIADTTGVSYADNVNLSHSANITVRARGGSSGGWPSLQLVVDGSNVGSPVEINSSASPATFNIDANISSGSHDIGFKGVNVATGRNAFVDVVSFPASGSGGTDTTPPNVTIDTGPGDTSDGAATFTFSANEPATFECKLLRGTTTISPWATCPPPTKTYSGLADGDYRFRVRATDQSNNVSVISSLNFTVTNGGTDTTPPTVTINSGPGDTSDGAATFTFSASEPATFECKLLRGTTTISPWATCPPPTKTYSGLADGDYRFRVRATDQSNNVSVISSLNFTVTNGGGGDGDADGDGVPDSTDQCPMEAGLPPTGCPADPGADRDDDTISDASDNCDCVANKDQVDTDGDGIGDACDAESGPPPTGPAFLVGAGDISSGGNRDQETGNLIDKLRPYAWGVFTTGDNAYPDGTYQNYQVYDAAWGCFRDMTRPTYGNHDYYGSSTAEGSQQYWNEGPDPTPVEVSNEKSFYAYDVGSSNWRAIVLNSASTEGPTSNRAPSCADPSTQRTFLISELQAARNTNKNTVLFWHHARFSASSDHPTSEGATGCSKTFFDLAHDNGADLVLQGHSHLYERYDTRDKSGTKVAGGLTSIVCGTGGNSFDGLQGSPSPAYDRAFTNAWGVCKLTLTTNNAQVNFLPAPGSPGSDSATVAVRP